METQTRIDRLTDEEFQRKYGVNRTTFEEMENVLHDVYRRDHARGGRPPKLSVRDRLCACLTYYREYRTMENIAIDYNVANSTLCDAIRWTEDTLVKSGLFALPSKRALNGDGAPNIVLVDVTECETERPKKATEGILGKKEETYAQSTGSSGRSNRGYRVCVLCAGA